MDWQLETATWPRRTIALVVDWAACILVLIAVGGTDAYTDTSGGFWIAGIYWVEATLFTAVAGGSFGQLATRLRVVRQTREGQLTSVPVALSALRHAMVLLVIPPLVFRPDGRGLHDLAVRSGVVRLETLRAVSGR